MMNVMGLGQATSEPPSKFSFVSWNLDGLYLSTYYLIKGAIFGKKKIIEHKIGVLIFPKNFI